MKRGLFPPLVAPRSLSHSPSTTDNVAHGVLFGQVLVNRHGRQAVRGAEHLGAEAFTVAECRRARQDCEWTQDLAATRDELLGLVRPGCAVQSPLGVLDLLPPRPRVLDRSARGLGGSLRENTQLHGSVAQCRRSERMQQLQDLDAGVAQVGLLLVD